MPDSNSDERVPVLRTPSKADYKRYDALVKEIHQDIELIDTTLRRVTRNLKAIHDRSLYLCGGYSSFGEFCTKEFGKSRQQVYRLLQANDVMQNLLESGVAEADLPQTERLCREIRKLENEEEQARVWKAVARITRDRGRPATIVDVQEVAAKEVKSQSAIDRAQTELIQKFEGINRSLKAGYDFELLTPEFRNRLLYTLQEIVNSVQIIMTTFKSSALERRTGPPREEHSVQREVSKPKSETGKKLKSFTAGPIKFDIHWPEEKNFPRKDSTKERES